ncbi:MAG: PilN domain-containing protein [Rhodanobacteraceae bacterium]
MNRFSPGFERARLAWQRSPAPRFFAWWGGELSALLPVRLRAHLLRGPDVLLLSAHLDALRVRRERTGDTLAQIAWTLPIEEQRAMFAQACRGIDASDRRLVLLLPPGCALRRRLQLPAAAASDLRRVLGYEIDRQTPFKPEQVDYDVRVLDAGAPPGQLVVELIAAPRVQIDPLLERLRGLGIAPDAVDVCVDDTPGAGRVGVNLLPLGSRPRRAHPRRRINAILAAACVLLAVLAMSQWLANRRTALDAMQAQVDTLHAQARQASGLREELVNAAGASGFLAARKRATPSALSVLQDLTARLPPDTWLERFSLDAQGGVDMQGESAKAAGLIDTLRASPLLTEPKLQGVIQPDPATGKERFDLSAQLRANGEPSHAR